MVINKTLSVALNQSLSLIIHISPIGVKCIILFKGKEIIKIKNYGFLGQNKTGGVGACSELKAFLMIFYVIKGIFNNLLYFACCYKVKFKTFS